MISNIFIRLKLAPASFTSPNTISQNECPPTPLFLFFARHRRPRPFCDISTPYGWYSDRNSSWFLEMAPRRALRTFRMASVDSKPSSIRAMEVSSAARPSP